MSAHSPQDPAHGGRSRASERPAAAKDGAAHPAARLFPVWIFALALCGLVISLAFAGLSASDPEAPPAFSALPSAPGAGFAVPALPPAPPFDADGAEYLLTAFPLQGMRQLGGAEPAFVLLPPGLEAAAQLIRRDVSPEVIGPDEAAEGGIELRLILDEAYAGAANAGAGESLLVPEGRAFVASPPVLLYPFDREGRFSPYPTARVEARGREGGPLAASRLVLPLSSETGCRNCHTGFWKTEGRAGIGPATAGDILAVHDRRNGTRFVRDAASGEGPECASCHSGEGDAPELSAAVHGFHATMKLRGPEACGLCHASAEDGATRFFRGLHAARGLDCTRCHGDLAAHAIALLRHEKDRGAASPVARLEQLRLLSQRAPEDIPPRKAGRNMPSCLGCHDFKVKPDPALASAFGKWTADESERFSRALDNSGSLRCPSCHGPAHALYPAENPAGDGRDGIQPLQYQGVAAPLGAQGRCAVCHTVSLDGFIHHDRVGD